jgi:glycosyltransferase involved in cell wall biosynthesis
MKVLVFTKYHRMGASSRLRTLQYLPFLEQQEFEFTVSSLFDETYLENLYNNDSRSRSAVFKYYSKRLLTLFTVWRYDLIWIEKELFPYLPAFSEQFLALIGKKYVVDYDDAIFHNYDLSDSPIVRRFLAKKIDTVMANSGCVIAGNDYLAERAQVAGAKRIEWVPTVIDQSRYKPLVKAEGSSKVIGWIGSPSTQKYVLDIKQALRAVCERHSARLLLVGATQDIVDQLPDIKVDVVPWSEDSEVQLIQKMDIGIMPLPDGPWEKGKCGYKLIQYMACGVPVIASAVGVNIDIINNSECGYLAKNEKQWVNSLDALLSSTEHRKTFGKAGRNAVEETYSLQVQAPILARILSAIGKNDLK